MHIAYVMQEGAPDVRVRPLTGPANHVVKVYEGLRANGHSMRFLARYDGQILKSDDLRTFEKVTVRGFDHGPFRVFERLVRGVQSRLGLPYANWFESRRFAGACLQELANCHVVYERLGWMSQGGGRAAARLGVPLVLEVNNGDFVTELKSLGVAPAGLQLRLCISLMRRAIGRAGHIIASGVAHRERFIEHWGVSPAKVSVVENGSEVVDLLARHELRSFGQPGSASRPVEVVFLGAFEPWHGILKLLGAFADALRQVRDLRLTLIGGGTLMPQVRERIDALRIGSSVHVTGPLGIHDVSRYLAAADIGAAPYCGWMEYSGLKIFDYKAAGLAVVCSGERGHPPTIRHGETGWIVPPCDERALSEALKMLATDAGLRRRLGQAARLEAEAVHSWRHTVTALEVVIARECLAREGPPPDLYAPQRGAHFFR